MLFGIRPAGLYVCLAACLLFLTRSNYQQNNGVRKGHFSITEVIEGKCVPNIYNNNNKNKNTIEVPQTNRIMYIHTYTYTYKFQHIVQTNAWAKTDTPVHSSICELRA